MVQSFIAAVNVVYFWNNVTKFTLWHIKNLISILYQKIYKRSTNITCIMTVSAIIREELTIKCMRITTQRSQYFFFFCYKTGPVCVAHLLWNYLAIGFKIDAQCYHRQLKNVYILQWITCNFCMNKLYFFN